MSIIERIESLYLWRGRRPYEMELLEPISVLEHSLQAAQMAEWDDAAQALVAATFLHDIGRLLPLPPGADVIDDVHELRGVAFLAEAFEAEVIEPIRLHVQARRYLVARGAGYEVQLSPASAHALSLQGGPMTDFEVRLFLELPFAADAIQLRLYDDGARHPGKRTPPLRYFLDKLDKFLQPPHRQRTTIGAFDAAQGHRRVTSNRQAEPLTQEVPWTNTP